MKHLSLFHLHPRLTRHALEKAVDASFGIDTPARDATFACEVSDTTHQIKGSLENIEHFSSVALSIYLSIIPKLPYPTTFGRYSLNQFLSGEKSIFFAEVLGFICSKKLDVEEMVIRNSR